MKSEVNGRTAPSNGDDTRTAGTHWKETELKTEEASEEVAEEANNYVDDTMVDFDGFRSISEEDEAKARSFELNIQALEKIKSFGLNIQTSEHGSDVSEAGAKKEIRKEDGGSEAEENKEKRDGNLEEDEEDLIDTPNSPGSNPNSNSIIINTPEENSTTPIVTKAKTRSRSNKGSVVANEVQKGTLNV